MSKSYSKTKEELKILLNQLIESNGSELKIRLYKIQQRDQYQIYTGKITIDKIYTLLSYKHNFDQIKNPFKKSKVNDIEKSATEDSQRFSSFTSIFIGLDTNKNYIKFLPDPSDDSIILYIVELQKLYNIISNSETDEDGYIKDESLIFAGTLLDGHHQAAELYKAGNLNFEFPITAFIGLYGHNTPECTPECFRKINQHQEKPSKVYTLAMKAIAGTLYN